MRTFLHHLLAASFLLLLVGCPSDDDDTATDDDDTVEDDDDTVVDDDDSTDDDDVVDDDDVIDDDDSTDDDDIIDDDDIVDDDDSAPQECDEVGELSCPSDNMAEASNDGAGSTDAIENWSGCFMAEDLTGPEIAFAWTAPADESTYVELTGLQDDVDLLLLSGSCEPASCIDYSWNGGTDDEWLLFDAVAGTTYYFVVDGYGGAVSEFLLTLECETGDDDDSAGDDDDSAVDDDDSAADDDDSAADDDDSAADDDDSAVDDDDVADDDDSAAGVDNDADGWTDLDGDCDDSDPLVNPGATEVLDDLDNDCDGVANDGVVADGDIVITEILKNPTWSGDNCGEYFEVYNTAAVDIAITGWEIGDTDDTCAAMSNLLVMPELVIPAGSFALLAAEEIPADCPAGDGLDPLYSWVHNYPVGFFLSNGGDEIYICVDGYQVDAVEYADATFPDTDNVAFGLNPALGFAVDNNDGANWCDQSSALPSPSTDLGTPGVANDACAP